MSQLMEVVYEEGVLKPLGELTLAEHQRFLVELPDTPAPADEVNGLAEPESETARPGTKDRSEMLIAPPANVWEVYQKLRRTYDLEELDIEPDHIFTIEADPASRHDSPWQE